ncbi:MAG: PilW family protein [Aquisalimonadaceae bacterium]
MNRYLQAGFSLVEIMVAMTISLIILAAITQVFMSSRKTYAVNEAVARVQEDARFAAEIPASDIRMAGYSGCGRLGRKLITFLADTEDRPAVDFGSESSLIGYGNDWENPSATITHVDNTDVIVVRRGDGLNMRPVGNPNGSQIKVTGNVHNIAKDDLIMITDCTQADVISINNPAKPNAQGELTLVYASNDNHAPGDDCPSAYARRESGPGQPPGPGLGLIENVGQGLGSGGQNPGGGRPLLCGSYGTDADIMRFIQHTYFIGEQAGQRALYRINTHGVAEALVQNVESMRVLYGLDTRGVRVADTYLPHSEIPAHRWAEVISLRFELVVSSDPILPEPMAVSFPVFGSAHETHPIAADDRRMRRLVSKTVTLRNRAR